MTHMSAIESITPAQYERLPDVLAEIVNCDRLLGNIRRRPLCSFADLVEFKRLKTLRSEARAGAHAKWGYQLAGKGDNTSPA